MHRYLNALDERRLRFTFYIFHVPCIQPSHVKTAFVKPSTKVKNSIFRGYRKTNVWETI